MKRYSIITFIIYTSLGVSMHAEASTSANQLMFVGAVVHPHCTTSNTGRTLALSCLNDAATEVEVEKYEIASLAKMHTLRSKRKTIALSPIKNKPGLARVTVAYD
ncbi:MAG: hypothetical protein ACRCWR_02405 [Saezia sp.]